MRCWRWAASLLVLGVLALLTGCADEETDPAGVRTPRLGAPAPTPSEPPDEPMDDLEEPVAERLGSRLEGDGLTLEYVDCPRWTGDAPSTLTCKGYVDGVVGEVDVELSRAGDGRTEFDAWLGEGVLATERLVARLQREGYKAVDCGATPAYPARPGMRMVCRVEQDGSTGYLVATVTDRRGAVRIRDY